MLESRLKIVIALLMLMAIVIVSTLGLVYFEHWSVFDSLWVTIESLTTTGYGNKLPQTFQGRLFLLSVLLMGVGTVAYSFSVIISALVENQISRIVERNKMEKDIRKLDKHIIVCGAGRVGCNVIEVLQREGMPYILIDQDETVVNELQEQGYLVLTGDATQDDVLFSAGIERAAGIVCALSEDAYNVFIALTARATNPDLKIIARAERPETVEKLRRAGADKVIAPAQIGGYQMAMAILKPMTVDMVKTVWASSDIQLQLEEISISENSIMNNQCIQDIFDRQRNNIIVVSIIRDGDFRINPQETDIIMAGDVLVIIGSKEDLSKLEELSEETVKKSTCSF